MNSVFASYSNRAHHQDNPAKMAAFKLVNGSIVKEEINEDLNSTSSSDESRMWWFSTPKSYVDGIEERFFIDTGVPIFNFPHPDIGNSMRELFGEDRIEIDSGFTDEEEEEDDMVDFIRR